MIINKDILTVESGVIVQSCNCMGPMGGLAGAIRKKWPIVGTEYSYLLRSVKAEHKFSLLGTCQIVKVEPSLYVANIFGQYNISTKERQTEYCAIFKGLGNLMDQIDVNCNVYFPYKFGCGLGGGDWAIVSEIISYYLPESFICKNI